MSVPEIRQLSGGKEVQTDDKHSVTYPAPPAQSAPLPRSALQAAPFDLRESSTPDEIHVHFELPEYAIEEVAHADGSVWHRVTAHGTSQLNRPGAPALPVFRTDLALPRNAVAEIELVDAEYIVIHGIRPEPACGPQLGTSDGLPEPTPNAEIYGNLEPYPAEPLAIASHYQIRSTNGYGVVLAPFQYLPETQELRIATTVDFVIRATGDASGDATLDAQPDFAHLQRNTYLNAESLQAAETPTVGTLQIVYPSKWTAQIQTALNNFVTWKRQVGWSVHAVGYPADTGEGAAALKAYLQEQYDATAFTHLVLIGDYAAIPPYQHQGTDVAGRNAQQLAASNTAILYTLCASDVPYAFLDGTDDLLYQDALLSRLPVSSYAHLNSLLNRLRIFEQGTGLASQANPEWLTTGLFLADSQASSSSSNPYYGIKDETIVAQAADALRSAGVVTDATELYESAGTPTAEEVQAALDAGAALFYYLGHGTCTSFVTSDFSTDNAATLDNKLMLPYIVAPNCSSGNLEHGTDTDVSTHVSGETERDVCLAQALFDSQANTTVQALVAATEVAFWTPPIIQLQAFADLQAQWRTAERLATSGALATGSLNTAIRYCETFHDQYGSYYLTKHHARFEAWEMHLYGDASAVPRCGPLNPLTVTATTCRDDATVKVAVTGFGNNSPVPNAAVCVEADGEYYSTRTDAAGTATLRLPAVPATATLRVLDASAPRYERSLAFLSENAITVTGATVALTDSTTLVFTATLPEEADEEDYDYAWSSTPDLEFSGTGRTTTLALKDLSAYLWQSIPVAVTCTASPRGLQITLEKGWNLVAIALEPDARSQEILQGLAAARLDSEQHAYIHPNDLTAPGVYWLFAPSAQTLALTGTPAAIELPKGTDWQTYGASAENILENCEVWLWNNHAFQPQPDAKILPNCGHWLREKSE